MGEIWQLERTKECIDSAAITGGVEELGEGRSGGGWEKGKGAWQVLMASGI